MKLNLNHAANIDICGGYWQEPTDPKRQTAEVTNIKEARKTFNAWQNRNGLGSGNMTRKTGELHDGKTLVGRFSYNGRFWLPDGTELPQIGQKTAAQHEAEGWSDFKLTAS